MSMKSHGHPSRSEIHSLGPSPRIFESPVVRNISKMIERLELWSRTHSVIEGFKLWFRTHSFIRTSGYSFWIHPSPQSRRQVRERFMNLIPEAVP